MSLSWPHQLALKTYSTTKMFPREETFSLGPRHSEKSTVAQCQTQKERLLLLLNAK